MKVETEVLAVLSAAETKGNALVLVGQLERRLYERTNKVLDAAGGKWNKKAKAHLFDGDAADAMEQIILTGEVSFAKQEFGIFFTPPPVVQRVLRLADIKPGMSVLEPSAGQGAIAREAAVLGADVDCVEILAKNVDMLHAADFANAVQHGDFLAIAPAPDYDRIVMNPPFAKQADIHHVTHAAKFLKPGGRLVAVMSAGVRFRDNRLTTSFRDMVSECGGAIEDVPDGAFRESGTMVNTVIVTMNGPAA